MDEYMYSTVLYMNESGTLLTVQYEPPHEITRIRAIYPRVPQPAHLRCVCYKNVPIAINISREVFVATPCVCEFYHNLVQLAQPR